MRPETIDRLVIEDTLFIFFNYIGIYIYIYLFATSACAFNYVPVSREFGFEAFCVWFIFDRIWNLIPKMGSTESKSVCTVFRVYDFRKA